MTLDNNNTNGAPQEENLLKRLIKLRLERRNTAHHDEFEKDVNIESPLINKQTYKMNTQVKNLMKVS